MTTSINFLSLTLDLDYSVFYGDVTVNAMWLRATQLPELADLLDYHGLDSSLQVDLPRMNTPLSEWVDVSVLIGRFEYGHEIVLDELYKEIER